MTGRRRIVVVGLAVMALAVGGCASADDGSGTSPSASPTVTTSPMDRARAAVLTSEELPAAPPGTVVDAGLGFTAEGDQVAAPWTQVWFCAGISRPDEGPPTDVEPGAAAAVWGFGTAGAAQVDQYAIDYVDQASAQAAVARAREQADTCIETFMGNAEYAGDPPEIEVGATPVEGLRVRVIFPGDDSDMISTVMRSGTTVQYVRANALYGYETETGETAHNEDQMLDPQYVEQLIAAAAASLAG